MARLGKNQIEALACMSSIGRCYVTSNKHVERLVSLGLAASDMPDGKSFFRITANGLRRLADEADAGHLILAVTQRMLREGRT